MLQPWQGTLPRGCTEMMQTCYLWLCAMRRFMWGEPWIGCWSCLKMEPCLTEDLSHVVQICQIWPAETLGELLCLKWCSSEQSSLGTMNLNSSQATRNDPATLQRRMDRVMHKVTLIARNQEQQSNTTHTASRKAKSPALSKSWQKIRISTNQKLPWPCSCSVKLMLLSASLLIAADKKVMFTEQL